jgi:hypothetical protein
MAGLDALVNIGRGASFGLSDTIANWISPGASCTVPQNSLDQFLGSQATGLVGAVGLGKLADGLMGLAGGDAAATAPKPPGFDPETWTQMPGTREGAGLHWWDPNGGEWRWHAPDSWHPTGHWDYNPWDAWNSPWQNTYPPK